MEVSKGWRGQGRTGGGMGELDGELDGRVRWENVSGSAHDVLL